MLLNYKDEGFSKIIMMLTILFIILGSFYFLSIKKDFHNGTLVWEFTSYFGTLFYTIWFWYISTNGKEILIKLSKSDPVKSFRIIGPVIALLALITVFHFILIFGKNILCDFLTQNSVIITLALIVIVYIIFYYINSLVIENNGTDSLTKELSNTFNCVDKPSLYIFITLLLYSIYVSYTGNLQSMEMFFSGAIAFELLLSGYIWTRTQVA
jgi:hypothetical protein